MPRAEVIFDKQIVYMAVPDGFHIIIPRARIVTCLKSDQKHITFLFLKKHIPESLAVGGSKFFLM